MSRHCPGRASAEVRQFLAQALRGSCPQWPADWASTAAEESLAEAIIYHGIAGLLIEQAGTLPGWPAAVVAALRVQATAQAMWEIPHRMAIGQLANALDQAGVTAVLMKGTALAYDLYDQPASRSRGDTDVLVDRANLGAVRTALRALGFSRPAASDKLALQETWTLRQGEFRHEIDLHWAPLNSQALQNVISTEECLSAARPLPRLAATALTMNRVLLLLHTCLHRAMHRTAPYFAGGETYFGEDRLIWSSDIHRLANALSQTEWQQFTRLAVARKSAAACLSGLEAAKRDLGAAVPEAVIAELRRHATAEGTTYLAQSRSIARAWQDARAVPGLLPKLHYLRTRLFPSAEFMRAKYPRSPAPLALLYARRLADSLRLRAKAGP